MCRVNCPILLVPWVDADMELRPARTCDYSFDHGADGFIRNSWGWRKLLGSDGTSRATMLYICPANMWQASSADDAHLGLWTSGGAWPHQYGWLAPWSDDNA